MLEAESGIALHALILESRKLSGERLANLVESCFARCLTTRVSSIRRAQQVLESSAFDLVVLALDPFRRTHLTLLAALSEHPTPMPTVLLVGADDEERLYEAHPELPATWEVLPSAPLALNVLRRRIQKAVHIHENRWELQHLHRAFQSSLVQYRNLFDEIPDLIFLTDRSGCLLDVNETAVRMFGKPKEALLMRPIFEVFGIRKPDFDLLLDRAIAEDSPIKDHEIEFRPGGGESIYGLTHLIRWEAGPGRPVQFQGMIKDISPHKRMEQQLRRSEDNYKTLYELARISSASLKLEDVVNRSMELIHNHFGAAGTILLLNRAYERLDLFGAIELPDRLLAELQRGTPPIIGRDLIGRLAITGEEVHRISDPREPGLHTVIAEWLRGRPDHEIVGITLGRNNPSVPVGMLLMLLPLREEGVDRELLLGLAKSLEMGMTNCLHYANLQEAERRYRDLWDRAPTFFMSMLKGGLIFEINQTAVQALGYELPELIGKPVTRIIEPEDHALYERAHATLMETGRPAAYELRMIHKDGSRMIVSVNSEPMQDANDETIGEKCVLHDVTRQKEMEARLRDYTDNLEKRVTDRTAELTQTMNFLNGILEGPTEYAIMGLDEGGRFLLFNRGAQLLFGYSADDMVDRRDIGELIDFEGAPWHTLQALLETADRERVIVQETPMVTARRQRLTALLTINRLKAAAANNLTYVAIVRDITEQKELEDLLKLYTENLQQVIEQKTRELDNQHVQLIQSSKLATLGEMATGIAHELNQPLSGIRTRAQFVAKSIERKVFKPEYIGQKQEEVIQLVDRITHIINHMRIFARQDQQRFVPFNITQSIDGALSLIGEQLRIHAIEVQREVPDTLPLVLGEALQIEQVIINLLSNARDAMDQRADEERRTHGPGGSSYHKVLRIRVRIVQEGELWVEIADNGPGMDEDTRRRVFEPFFTTKPVGRGTGLGLSISYGIVTSHNGRFEVDSAAGQGTTFRLILPVWNDADGAEAADAEGDPPPGPIAPRSPLDAPS